MRTNIDLNEKLLEEAFRLSESKTKKELVHEALEEYIIHHRVKNLMELKGKIDFSEDYDYKKMREGK